MLVLKRPIYTRVFDNIDLVLIHSNKELRLSWNKINSHHKCALHIYKALLHLKFIHCRAEYYINWIRIKHIATFSSLQKFQNMLFQKIGLHYWIFLWYDYYTEPLTTNLKHWKGKPSERPQLYLAWNQSYNKESC